MAPSWGVMAQVKASLLAVQTFVAWHLDQGASQVWIYFDDPEDPAQAGLAPVDPRLRTFRCGPQYWDKVKGKRPERKTERQTANALHAYRRMKVDWMAHVDVDEFILPLRRAGDERPDDWRVTDALAEVVPHLPPEQMAIRIRPYEALTPPDGSAPQHFRGGPVNLPRQHPIFAQIYGRFAPGLINGMMSHSIGKAFSRGGIEGLRPRIHVARLDGAEIVAGGFQRNLALLHYHAVSEADWLSHLGYRVSLGAYSGRAESRAFFEAADPAEIAAFYQAVQVAHPDLLARLEEAGLLLTGAPPLEQVRARWFGPAPAPTS